jgi:outer membrane protein TolC
MEELDVDQLSLMESNLSNQLENAKMQQANARAMLKFMLAMPLDSEIELTDELEVLLSEEKAEAMILQNLSISKHRDMLLLDEGINLQQINLKVTQSGYLPTLSAFFQHQQMNMTNEIDFQTWFPNTVWGVNLNVPIFTSFSTRSKAQKVKVGIDKLEVQRAQLGSSLELQALSAKSSLITALNSYKNEKKNLELARKIQDKTLEKFNLGMASSLELSQAESQLITTQGNYVQSIFNVLTAQTELYNALGL